jgi:hypothetical protein
LEQFLPIARPGEARLAEECAKDRVDAVGMTLYQAADRQGRDRLVAEIFIQLGEGCAVADQRGIGEEGIEAAEVPVEVEPFGGVVDQRDAVGVQQLVR